MKDYYTKSLTLCKNIEFIIEYLTFNYDCDYII